jgi:hypothetical protein
LELGQAETLSFICVVIALYRVRKGSELLRLDVRKELDVQAALPVSIEPPLAWWLIQLFGWGAEQSPDLVLALSGELYRRLVRRSGSRRIGSRSRVFGLASSTDVALFLATGLAAATFRLCGVGGEERARERSSLIERSC